LVEANGGSTSGYGQDIAIFHRFEAKLIADFIGFANPPSRNIVDFGLLLLIRDRSRE
jgi:hypothetical protein